MTGDSTYGDGTDGLFGFVVGFYAAALAAPAVAIAVALGVTTDPGVLFFTLLGTTVVVTGSVGWVARRESLAVRLGATRWVWTSMGLPFLYFAGLFGASIARGEDPSSAVAGLAIVGALAGVIVGTGLAAAARNRHTKMVLADAEELVRFSASAPERDCRIAKQVAVSVVVVSAVGMVASMVAEAELFRGVFQILTPFGAGLFGTTTERNVRVTDEGLMVGNAIQKTVRPWSAYESYDVTDEVIVVRRAGWSAWGLRDLRRDSEAVENPEAVSSALGEFLPRRG